MTVNESEDASSPMPAPRCETGVELERKLDGFVVLNEGAIERGGGETIRIGFRSGRGAGFQFSGSYTESAAAA